ncbi:MAG: YihY/virulence factor BrkB family protein [Nostocoides sp.]
MIGALKRWWGVVAESRAWRAWKRYGEVRGSLLAGGVTYYAFLSLFPAVALGFTVFGVLLKGHPEYLDAIRTYLNGMLPGFVQDGDNAGIISLSAPTSSTLSITGAVGVVGLLWSGLGWLSGTRTGIRTVYGAEGNPGNFVTAKLRDLLVMVIFGLGIVISAVVTVMSGGVASHIAEALGFGDAGRLLNLVGLVLGVIVDGALTALMLRLLSGVPMTRASLIQGALVGGLGLTVLKVLGTTLIGGTLNNPVYGSIALVVGLLVWLNFISRVVLLAAAWSKVVLHDEGQDPQAESDEEHPEPHTEVAVDEVTAQPSLEPVDGRANKRAGLVTGTVLGAAAATAVGTLRRRGRRGRSPGGPGTPSE